MEKIFIKVPNDSSDFEIDTFLGNSLSYRVGYSFKYDYSILPSSDLKIIGVLNKYECIENKLDTDTRWLSILVS